MLKATKFTTALAGSTILLASACTDPAMLDANNNYQKTQNGALIGAVTGAVVGAATSSDSKDGAIKGAVIGAAGGAVIGNILDRQEADLRAAIGNDDIKIVNTGDRLIVTMPQDILFAVDSASLSPSMRSDLRAVATNLNQYPDSTVQVLGHTDNTGEAGYNLDLSQRRAAAVSSVLTSSGVAPSRVQTIGRGEDQPVATNLTPEGRAQNRRVDIVILPNAA